MGDLTTNFSRWEFECQCGTDCGYIAVDFELVNVLQDLVEHFKTKYGQRVSVEITGPNRCPPHNKAENGAPGSKHQFCIAADFKVKLVDTNHKINPREVYDYLDIKYTGKFGIGLYHNRVHLDIRPERARWGI